jgi:hypothetical protein
MTMTTTGPRPDEDLGVGKDLSAPPAAEPPPSQPVPPAVPPSDPSASPATSDAPGGAGDTASQAAREEIEPLPYDGVASVAVGTLLWLVALVSMIPFKGDLEAAGRLWWLATAAVGFGFGLLGLLVVTRRRARLRRRNFTDFGDHA